MVFITKFTVYEESVASVLEEAMLPQALEDAGNIVIKPNLLQDSPPPTTTDVRCVEAIVRFIQDRCPGHTITVAEGSGGCSTEKAFSILGYETMARTCRIELIDLDKQPNGEYRAEGALEWDTVYLPEMLLEDVFLISVPVLKHHTITQVTLSLKNLIGILPAEHYSGYWSYRKSMVHKYDVEKVIHDIHCVRKVDFAVIDAAVGQEGSHLRGGRPFDPPAGKIIAARNPIEADEAGSRLLGIHPDDVEHIQYCKRVYDS